MEEKGILVPLSVTKGYVYIDTLNSLYSRVIHVSSVLYCPAITCLNTVYYPISSPFFYSLFIYIVSHFLLIWFSQVSFTRLT